MDLNKIKARLSALTTKNTKTKIIWKPTAGKSQQIRIVPYKKDPSSPFIELQFHYGINNKTYISPSSFGRPDPFIEFADKLKKTGNKDDWKTGRKFEPKMRTYVPIIVRGEESEGVKFWGFGKQVYESLLNVIADDDYGDITDPMNGRDIVVEYTEASGADFAKTNVRVKPNQTPMTTDKSVLESIKNQADLLEVYPELSYDELADVLQKYLSPDETEAEPNVEASDSSEEVETTEPLSSPSLEKIKAPLVEKSASQEKKTVESSKKVDLDALSSEFDSLFNQ
jgi:hypothetical protein